MEAGIMPGKGRLTITGKLGRGRHARSAQAAMSYVRRSSAWGLEADFYQHVDIHIHVPEGAMPSKMVRRRASLCAQPSYPL